MLRFIGIFAITAFFVTACIATRSDIDVAKAELRAEANAKRQVLETKIMEDIKLINERLEKIEKKLAMNKEAQENKINLSFSTLDELKSTIKELNNRIDTVDVSSQKVDADTAAAIKKISDQVEKISSQLDSANKQAEENKPVENVTSDKKGNIKLPNDHEKAFSQLVKLTQDNTLGEAAREGWKKFAEKWPKKNECEVAFYTAETYYNEKTFNTAIDHYRKIEKDFKDCEKLEMTYIRIAYSLYFVDKKDVSKKVLTALKLKYPKSQHTKQIKELENMLNPADSKPAEKKPAEKKTKKNR